MNDTPLIARPEDIPSELKRFRELIAQNREERLRLSKNLAKVTRQVAKTKARTRDAVQNLARPNTAAVISPNPSKINSIYSQLAETFKSIEARNPSAQKCLSRLVLRCESCCEREMTAADHASQLEGIQFEYLLALKSQGADEPQIDKYAAVEELITILRKVLPRDKGA